MRPLLCKFKRLIYQASPDAYTVALYKPCESVLDSSGRRIGEVKAVGWYLPTAEKLKYDLKGHWSKTAKHGIQFEVETYDEVIEPTREGVIAYLSSGQIKGVGPKTAEKIYETFGDDTLNVLDTEPEKLLAIRGISENKLRKIRDSYLASRGARDVVTFLAPYGITPNRAVKLYQHYGERTLDVLRNHPYRLCELSGVGFITADRIAMSLGLDRCSPERIEAALLYTLTEAESRGHLCLEKHEFIKRCLAVLDTPELTVDVVANTAARLVMCGALDTYKGMAYRSSAATAENLLARRICGLLAGNRKPIPSDLPLRLDALEHRLNLNLNDEQRAAVLTALTSPVSIITGGPGTGKTLTQRAILELYRELYPAEEVLCCAPTGRAARRMEEATGFPASTIHRAFGIYAGDGYERCEPETPEAGLVLVDEASMIDAYLAEKMLSALPPDCRLVLVGDCDQLPSVGPGAVLSELIASRCIPVVRLERIYRQSRGSRIVTNAKLIRSGNLALEYGEDFQFYESSDLERSAELLEKLYLRELEEFGVDNVALLTPFRQKTATCVNALNSLLRDKVNPPGKGKPEAAHGKRRFRLGDKVMQLKNYEQVSNGDVGYVTGIGSDGGDAVLTIDFGDGRLMEYSGDELDMLTLAYASTIHKSQGSEYKSVIINLQCAHSVMLVRPLIYTAVTRAKERVIIVGERRALCIAISREETLRRGTMLAGRIRELQEEKER